MADPENAQVRISLSTKEPGLELPQDTGAILVSTSLRRYALSTLVNNLLEKGERPIPFEFLVNGRFLKTSIDDYLTANGISPETTLLLEYVRAITPPAPVASFEHEDWVSSVDVLSATSPVACWAGKGDVQVGPGKARILSGCYDGALYVWDAASSELLARSSALSSTAQAIKSAKWLSPLRIASAGHDRAIRIWNYEESGNPNVPSSISLNVELYGHRSSVDAISVHTPSSRILSASADSTVGLWTSRTSEAPPVEDAVLPGAFRSANKKRKLNNRDHVSVRGPLSILKGHSGPVSAAAFSQMDSTVGYSTSWDHTLNTWDLVTESAVSTRRTMHPLLCVTELKELGLLAVGTSAKHVLAIDPRVDARNVVAMSLQGHTGSVVTADGDPFGRWGLVSGSLDGTCRIWDLRSVRSDGNPLALAVGGSAPVCESTFVVKRESAKDKRAVAGEGIKVFGVCWDGEAGIVSGGEDRRVQVNQTQNRT